jgi:membrane protein DedA with SNARE-associated domain
MSMPGYITAVTDFVRENQAAGPVIAGLLAFGESIVVVSFFVPAVGILFALAVAAGAAGGVAFLPLWAGIVIGASLGNLISWWIGTHYGEAFKQWKPIRERPGLVEKTEAAFKRWGVFAIFIGRFFGPLHGTIATIAAIGKMNPLVFHVANWLSAGVWAGAILYAGMQGGELASRFMGGG